MHSGAQTTSAIQEGQRELCFATGHRCAPPPKPSTSCNRTDLPWFGTNPRPRCLRKSCASSDHLPPVSHSFRRCAWAKAAPSVVGTARLGAPSALTVQTRVVSTASWAPWKSGKPSATTSRRRSSTRTPGRRPAQRNSPEGSLVVRAPLVSRLLHGGGYESRVVGHTGRKRQEAAQEEDPETLRIKTGSR